MQKTFSGGTVPDGIKKIPAAGERRWIDSMEKQENTANCCRAGFASVDLRAVLLPEKKNATPIESVGLFTEDPVSGESAFLFVSDFMDFDLATVQILEEAVKDSLPQKCSIHILTTHNHGGEVCDKLDMVQYGKLASLCAEKARCAAQEALVRSVHVQADPDLTMTRRLDLPETGGSATCFYGIAPESRRNGGPFAEHFLNGLREGTYPYTGGDSLQKIPYRSFPEGDRDLFGMEFISRKDGRTLGTVVRYAAHAVCCNDGKYYSADYPYFLREKMKSHFSGAPSLFLNGPCGEIAPCLYKKSPETARTFGETLAQTLLAPLQKQPFRVLEHFSGALKTVSLPVRQEIFSGNFEVPEQDWKTLSLPERKKYFEALNFRGSLPFLNAKYRNGEKTAPGNTVEVKLGLLRFNETLLLCFPGETFFATGRKICHAFPHTDLVTLTEHGRTVMYLPPEEEFHKGGYEAVCKLTAAHAEKVLQESAADFIKSFLAKR